MIAFVEHALACSLDDGERMHGNGLGLWKQGRAISVGRLTLRIAGGCVAGVSRFVEKVLPAGFPYLVTLPSFKVRRTEGPSSIMPTIPCFSPLMAVTALK